MRMKHSKYSKWMLTEGIEIYSWKLGNPNFSWFLSRTLDLYYCWRKNGVWEKGHVPGIVWVPGMGHQVKVLGFSQDRIQEWVLVKWKQVRSQRHILQVHLKRQVRPEGWVVTFYGLGNFTGSLVGGKSLSWRRGEDFQELLHHSHFGLLWPASWMPWSLWVIYHAKAL